MANIEQLPLYVEFFVPGTPATAGSKRGFYNKKLGRVLMSPASDKTRPWMATVSAYALDAIKDKGVILMGPVLLWAEFRLARPKSHFQGGKRSGELKPTAPRFSTSKPDTLKCGRAIEDAMTGIVWHDDAQVAIENLSKVYANPSQIPGATVKVYLLEKT